MSWSSDDFPWWFHVVVFFATHIRWIIAALVIGIGCLFLM